MPERDASPAGGEGYEAPGEQTRSYEETARCDEEEEEKGRRERFIREICERSHDLENRIMDGTEVIHAVLQVPHVAEEILGHFGSGFDNAGRREWWAVHGVSRCLGDRRRRRGMTDEECWDHDEEKGEGYGDDCEKVGVEADKGADGQKREGVGRNFPGKETNEAGLGDEQNPTSTDMIN